METRRKDFSPLRVALAVAVVAAFAFGGCASRSSYPTVPRSAAGTVQHLNGGTVVSVKAIVIDGTSSNVGRAAGAAIGGGIGRTVGSGDGTVLATAVGVAAGVVVGPIVEKELTKKVAQEVTIDLDDGHVIVVVQKTKDGGFFEGDRVEVMESITGVARIRHAEFESDGLYWN